MRGSIERGGDYYIITLLVEGGGGVGLHRAFTVIVNLKAPIVIAIIFSIYKAFHSTLPRRCII